MIKKEENDNTSGGFFSWLQEVWARDSKIIWSLVLLVGMVLGYSGDDVIKYVQSFGFNTPAVKECNCPVVTPEVRVENEEGNILPRVEVRTPRVEVRTN